MPVEILLFKKLAYKAIDFRQLEMGKKSSLNPHDFRTCKIFFFFTKGGQYPLKLDPFQRYTISPIYIFFLDR